jgi:spore coat protein A, manganese oxidase
MLWYHDHAMGIERLNLYAGLFGAYLLRDSAEDALNPPRGQYEIPLLLCDRMLRKDGQLYYPASQNPEGPWVPEVFGDCFLVNGKLMPYLDVEPRRYRFRILNASNGRFFRLTMENGQTFHQIGTDQGLLGEPVEVKRLQLAGGERADVIVDFSASAGSDIVLRNDILPLLQFRVSRSFRGPAALPAANEAGWKDTVRVEARGVTRIIVRFEGYSGRFVWHCHTLEHAANEMMRPYEIIPG